MIIMLVSLIISLPIALQSGTSAEARFEFSNFLDLSGCNYQFEVGEEATLSFPCIDKMILADYYFYQYLDCLDDPECSNSYELLVKLALWVYYENQLLQCLNPI